VWGSRTVVVAVVVVLDWVLGGGAAVGAGAAGAAGVAAAVVAGGAAGRAARAGEIDELEDESCTPAPAMPAPRSITISTPSRAGARLLVPTLLTVGPPPRLCGGCWRRRG
jgi:hypothetical protein